MNSGIYKIYNVIHGSPVKRLLGRLLVHDNKMHHLENHGSMDEIFPEGPITETHEKNLKKASNSHYWKVEKEEEVEGL